MYSRSDDSAEQSDNAPFFPDFLPCFLFSSNSIGFFATKNTLPKDAGKETMIKTTLRELLIYLAFLVVVSISEFCPLFMCHHQFIHFSSGLRVSIFSLWATFCLLRALLVFIAERGGSEWARKENDECSRLLRRQTHTKHPNDYFVSNDVLWWEKGEEEREVVEELHE